MADGGPRWQAVANCDERWQTVTKVTPILADSPHNLINLHMQVDTHSLWKASDVYSEIHELFLLAAPQAEV